MSAASPTTHRLAAFSATRVRARFTARITGTVSRAPLAALASAPVSSGALRSWVMTPATPKAGGRAQDGADVPRVCHLVQNQHRAGAFQNLGEGWLGQRVGQQGDALVDRVVAQHLVQPRAIGAFGLHAEGGLEDAGESGFGFLGYQQAADAAVRVGQGGGHRVHAVEPHGAGRGHGALALRARRVGGLARAGGAFLIVIRRLLDRGRGADLRARALRPGGVGARGFGVGIFRGVWRPRGVGAFRGACAIGRGGAVFARAGPACARFSEAGLAGGGLARTAIARVGRTRVGVARACAAVWPSGAAGGGGAAGGARAA